MRNSLLFTALIAILTFSACEEPLEEFKNGAPSPFAVQPVILNDSTAKIMWSKSIDPDGDSVIYDVYLSGAIQGASLRTTEFRFPQNLNSQITYTGTVIAKDPFLAETQVAFSFKTSGNDTTSSN
ncbi:hypothetical protein [Luteibaculum oceani]|uniref:SusE outer membrane protein domain-containing protein n=1 Tax=Luteibaculum oceani TaxID=1294296 RepID=A0A5C6UQG7_9FLAO|nr:hypothetical protein [Luteibaculum oceani]TXC75582.1 hypothetical protein FRX97_11965 [Luteibaculum oceani]